jgi:hypothetical protein
LDLEVLGERILRVGLGLLTGIVVILSFRYGVIFTGHKSFESFSVFCKVNEDTFSQFLG